MVVKSSLTVIGYPKPARARASDGAGPCRYRPGGGPEIVAPLAYSPVTLLILGEPLERRCDGPGPPRSSAVIAKGASEEANCGHISEWLSAMTAVTRRRVSSAGCGASRSSRWPGRRWTGPMSPGRPGRGSPVGVRAAGLGGQRRSPGIRSASSRRWPGTSRELQRAGPGRPVPSRGPDAGRRPVRRDRSPAGRRARHGPAGHAARPRRLRCHAGLADQRLDRVGAVRAGRRGPQRAPVPAEHRRDARFGAAFEEDDWVGSVVRIGAAAVRSTAGTRGASW